MRKIVKGPLNCTMWIACIALLSGCNKSFAPEANKSSAAFSSITVPKALLDAEFSILNLKKYSKTHQVAVKEFYSATSFKSKWLGNDGPNPLYQSLAASLTNAHIHGLPAEEYKIADLTEDIKTAYLHYPLTIMKVAALDIRITHTFFLFAEQLSDGKVTSLSGYWIREQKKSDKNIINMLASVRSHDELTAVIESLKPEQDQYTKLQHALALYKSLEKFDASFTTIVLKKKIKPNGIDPNIPAIRAKLNLIYPPTSAVDTISRNAGDSLLYNAELIAVVKRFQKHHGLEADGIIGGATLKFLNESFADKTKRIAVNMERLRWSTVKTEDDYVLVNIPEFKLRLFKEKKQTLEMNVVIGTPENQTPVFNDRLKQVVFSPTWSVPYSIFEEEVIPRLKTDPAYYTEKNYALYKREVLIDPVNEQWNSDVINPYQYRFIQQPGPDNSLGLVKFVMGNNMNIYMHDTPHRNLFAKPYRALSHGCIRLSKPDLFAEQLLKDQQWTKKNIDEYMHGGIPSLIPLKKYLKVYVEYTTAWVSEDGEIHFRDDIYKHDSNQLNQLYPVNRGWSVLASL